MTGPRRELPCGCVADTLDGERVWVVECVVHKLVGLVFAHVEVEPQRIFLIQKDSSGCRPASR